MSRIVTSTISSQTNLIERELRNIELLATAVVRNKKEGIFLSPLGVRAYCLGNVHLFPILLTERAIAGVVGVGDKAHKHLHVLESGCGISVPTADKFARYGVVLKDDSIVALEFNAVAVVTIVSAVVSALYGENVPTACDRAVLESGSILRGKSVKHGVSFLLRLRPLRNLLIFIIGIWLLPSIRFNENAKIIFPPQFLHKQAIDRVVSN